MSIEVTWPKSLSTSEKMAIDCLKQYFTPDGIDLIMQMSGGDRKRIFEFIKLSGHHVNERLIK